MHSVYKNKENNKNKIRSSPLAMCQFCIVMLDFQHFYISDLRSSQIIENSHCKTHDTHKTFTKCVICFVLWTTTTTTTKKQTPHRIMNSITKEYFAQVSNQRKHLQRVSDTHFQRTRTQQYIDLTLGIRFQFFFFSFESLFGPN